jgi:glycosyltransferase involved in cell wall biosynthesis
LGGTTIVIPCFNEERRLDAASFRPLTDAPDCHLLFVDDGSVDGTLRVLREACALLGPKASVLALEKNQGKAEAVRRGLLAAMEAGATVVGYLDADLATPPDEMLRLVKIVSEGAAQVALGSRVALLGRRIARKPSRHYLGRVFATMASILLDLRVYDTQCGAKAFAATPLLAKALDEPFHARWAFDVELIGRLLAGAEDLPGLGEDAFVEMPLRVWSDVAGSKLRPLHFPMLGLELVRIHFALARRRAKALPRAQGAASKHLA